MNSTDEECPPGTMRVGGGAIDQDGNVTRWSECAEPMTLAEFEALMEDLWRAIDGPETEEGE